MRSTFARSGAGVVAGAALSQGQVQLSRGFGGAAAPPMMFEAEVQASWHAPLIYWRPPDVLRGHPFVHRRLPPTVFSPPRQHVKNAAVD